MSAALFDQIAPAHLPDPSRLVLPWPVSANLYWRSFVPKGHRRAIVVVSDEAKAYKREVAWIAKAAGVRPLAGRVHLAYWLYPAMPLDAAKRKRKHGATWDDSVRSIDLDNAAKVLSDALNGIAYADDAQVWAITAQRMEPDGVARLVVQVDQIQVDLPQVGLDL